MDINNSSFPMLIGPFSVSGKYQSQFHQQKQGIKKKKKESQSTWEMRRGTG